MSQKSHTVINPPRPVTPLGIIAADIQALRDLAEQLHYTDPAFIAILERLRQRACGLEPYVEASTTPPSASLEHIAAETARRDWPTLAQNHTTAATLEQEMLSGHVEGQFLKMLVQAVGANKILEIGLFTGYSALAMAEGLNDQGTLIACEIDAYAAEVARACFDASTCGHKIQIKVGPALTSMHELVGQARFDFVFIDADKPQYSIYLDFLLSNDMLTEQSLILVDNTLLQGEAYVSGDKSVNGRAIADFNTFVASDARVEQVLLPLRDGVTLIRPVRG